MSHLDAAGGAAGAAAEAAAASSSPLLGGGAGAKYKADKPLHYHHYHHHHHHRYHHSHSPFLSRLAFWSFFALALFLALFLLSPTPNPNPNPNPNPSTAPVSSAAWGGAAWEKRVRASARGRRRPGGMAVLVTGAAGFVGSHAAAALRRRGDGVLGLDSFNDYYEPSLKRARAALLLSRSGVFVVDGDLNDGPLLRKLLDVAPFSHVLHLAAQAGVRRALSDPGSYVASNVAGLVSLLETLKDADPPPALVWASSSSVYGLNSRTPFSESDRTDRPASLYAATKKAGEEIAHAYNHIYGLSVTALCFFTVNGPCGRPDMAYFSFTRDILRGRPINFFEGPNHAPVARDFTYVDDVVAGCLAALDTAAPSSKKRRGPGPPVRVYNLGNTRPVPVADLVTALEKLLKVKALRKVVKMPRNGDVPFTHANITLAQRDLGYRPTTDLHAGLKRFVRWYLDYYASPSNKGGNKGGSGSGSSSSSSS
ncbi:UDP-glucuronate 4-epimerase 3-like [Ananas comosus]|uniref:UDP-glucuronate 4-epimerase n=1 Tax=Ananas comosus TaxID=4615 RepID=A0A6P5FQP0_ANACO|nr:UDP-glucuronate 4-epimerase 3-like [Ananas comosus]